MCTQVLLWTLSIDIDLFTVFLSQGDCCSVSVCECAHVCFCAHVHVRVCTYMYVCLCVWCRGWGLVGAFMHVSCSEVCLLLLAALYDTADQCWQRCFHGRKTALHGCSKKLPGLGNGQKSSLDFHRWVLNSHYLPFSPSLSLCLYFSLSTVQLKQTAWLMPSSSSCASHLLTRSLARRSQIRCSSYSALKKCLHLVMDTSIKIRNNRYIKTS